MAHKYTEAHKSGENAQQISQSALRKRMLMVDEVGEAVVCGGSGRLQITR